VIRVGALVNQLVTAPSPMAQAQSEHLDPKIRRIVDAARDVWIRRLIDHSRANSLLFYRDLKVGTLDLSGEMEAILRLLAGETLSTESLVTAGRYSESVDPVVRAGRSRRAAEGPKCRRIPSNARWKRRICTYV
jgi:hypothetical protein